MVSETAPDLTFERAPVALCRMHRGGVVAAANAEAVALAGVPREQILGRPFWVEAAHPEDRPHLTAALRAAGDAPTEVRVRLLLRAEALWVLFRLAAREGAVDAALVEAGHEDEAALLPGELLYRTFLEQSPVGLVHLDRAGVVSFENHPLRQITGEEPEEIWLGRDLRDIEGLDPYLPILVDTLLDSGRPFRDEAVTFQHADGERRHLRIHGTPIQHPEQGLLGAVLTVTDVTAERAREEELRVRRLYEHAAPALRRAALDRGEVGALLREAGRVFGETAQADAVWLLPPDDDLARSLWRHAAGADELRPLPHAREIRQSGARHLRRSAALSEERAALDALDAHEAYVLRLGDDRPLGALLLVRREDREAWSLVERKALDQLAALFENIWAWAEAEARYRQTVAHLHDALFAFTYDERGRRRYSLATAPIEDVTGYPPEAFVVGGGAVEWRDLVHPESADAFAAHETRLARGEHAEAVYRIRTADGETRWVRESATPDEDASGRLAVGGLLADVTGLREGEETLRAAVDAAESANRAKSAFFVSMSHEIRTPLGVINGFADVLLDEAAGIEGLPPTFVEFTTAIRDSGRKLLRLVNNLFDLVKLQAGDVRLDRVAVALPALAIRAASTRRDALLARGVVLDLDLPEDDVVVLADERRLAQALDQLLDNADKFTPEGSVTIRVRQEEGLGVLEVEDTGIGIEPENVERLFAPFAQEDGGLTRKFSGSGLGLALVRRIVDGLEGTLSVESTKGEGSRFTVRLPLAG